MFFLCVFTAVYIFHQVFCLRSLAVSKEKSSDLSI